MSPTATTAVTAPAPPATGTDISLNAGERGILLGATGTGKSTLELDLIKRFLAKYPTGHVLICDSKPRFRATFHPSGLRVKYKGWVDGDEIEGSVAVADETIPLKVAFLHSRVVIFQSRTAKKQRVPGYAWRCAEYAEQLFQFARKDRPCLLVVDEFYDILGPTGHADPRILSAIREGREFNLAVLAGAQRPRAIPVPILSEAANYYIFYLKYKDDLKRMAEFGPPIHLQPIDHQFLFYRNLRGGRAVEFLAELKVASK